MVLYMAFDKQVVYGLCNVLIKHIAEGSLNLGFTERDVISVEQWAKRMDLGFRDYKTDLEFVRKNEEVIKKNLSSIENLYSSLISELYKVGSSVQRELTRDMVDGNFVKMRLNIRQSYDKLKTPLANAKSLKSFERRVALNSGSVAATEVAIGVWFFSKKKRVPKKSDKDNKFFRFLRDCLDAFEISDDAISAYDSWYGLNQELRRRGEKV